MAFLKMSMDQFILASLSSLMGHALHVMASELPTCDYDAANRSVLNKVEINTSARVSNEFEWLDCIALK